MPSLMTTNEPQKQDNDFDGFDSTAGVMAFVYSKEGSEGLRALLTLLAADRESLLRDADELAVVGLPHVSDIVTEAAESAPKDYGKCPHSEVDDPANWRNWHRRHSGVFEGYYLDDEDRASRVKQLRG